MIHCEQKASILQIDGIGSSLFLIRNIMFICFCGPLPEYRTHASSNIWMPVDLVHYVGCARCPWEISICHSLLSGPWLHSSRRTISQQVRNQWVCTLAKCFHKRIRVWILKAVQMPALLHYTRTYQLNGFAFHLQAHLECSVSCGGTPGLISTAHKSTFCHLRQWCQHLGG